MLTTRSVVAVAALVIAAMTAIVMGSVRQHPATHPNSPAASVAAPTAPAVRTLTAAVVAADANSVTLAVGQRDTRYPVCSGASAPAVEPGQFADASVAGGCLKQLAVVPPPVCTPSAAAGSYVNGLWVGVNPSAHSVLYRTTGPQKPTFAGRWCQPPSGRAADGSSIDLAAIRPGTPVRVVTTSAGWVAAVVVQHGPRG